MTDATQPKNTPLGSWYLSIPILQNETNFLGQRVALGSSLELGHCSRDITVCLDTGLGVMGMTTFADLKSDDAGSSGSRYHMGSFYGRLGLGFNRFFSSSGGALTPVFRIGYASVGGADYEWSASSKHFSYSDYSNKGLFFQGGLEALGRPSKESPTITGEVGVTSMPGRPGEGNLFGPYIKFGLKLFF